MREPSPYRAGKPLANLIAPDRRRRNAALLLLGGMLAGAGLLEGGRRLAPLRHRAPPEVATVHLGVLAPTKLSGPDGDLRVPSADGLSVVHVWLQGCQDCMPAFEAMRDSEPCGAHVINVAYGEASPTWAGQYRVRHNLVLDPGGARVVRPLGIGSFTTLVLDPDGRILHRDRPDAPHYQDRMRPYCDPSRSR